MIVADLIAKRLFDVGARTVFGNTGGRILPLVHSINTHKGLDFICAANEQNAAFMADAYSRASGIGCCISTSGPGAINLLTGVAAAYYDSVPLLVITGQSELIDFGRGGIQEGSGRNRSPHIQAMFRAVAKASFLLESPDEALSVIDKAYSLAMTGRRGPVHIDIPYDILVAETACNVPIELPEVLEEVLAISIEKFEFVRQALLQAQRPCFIFGSGAASDSYAATALVRFCLNESIPYALTLGARGRFDERNSMFLGQVGVYGQDVANEFLLKTCDLPVFVGVSFQYLSTLGWHENIKPFISVNLEVINAMTQATNLQASAAEFANTLNQNARGVITEIVRQQILDDVQSLKSCKGLFPFERLEAISPCACGKGHKINPARVLAQVNKVESFQGPIVLDSGENAYWSMMSIHLKPGQNLYVNSGLGSMGYAVGAAIGLTHTKRYAKSTVLALIGDGGLLMALGDLATKVGAESRVIWIVFSNGIYGTQKHWQRDHYNGVFGGTDITNVKLDDMARAFEMQYFLVDDHDGLLDILSTVDELAQKVMVEWVLCPELKPVQAYGATLKK